MNQVVLMGKVYKVSPIKYTANSVAILTVVVSVSKKIKDEWDNQYFKCVVFGDLAEAWKSATMGTLISLVGELRNSSWEKDGVKHYKTNVSVYRGVLGSVAVPKSNYSQEHKPKSRPLPQTSQQQDNFFDDIPF